jgi:hypothetical protein
MKSNPAKLLTTLGLAGLVSGCTTTTTSTGLPHGSRVVGGGLSIEWKAPEPGSAILREETTHRVVATQTLDTDDSFDFPQSSSHHEALERLFGDPMPTNLTFVLYFVPTPPPKE